MDDLTPVRMVPIDLELRRAEVEVKELEARLKVVPMNDLALARALERSLEAKRERLRRLRGEPSLPQREPGRG